MKFNNSKRNKVGKLIKDIDTIADVVDILTNIDNCLLFKNNIEYKQARLI